MIGELKMNEEYQEIDLLELIQVVLRKWWLILLLMIVAGGSAYYATTEYVTPIYEAKATLFIGKDNSTIAGLNLSDLSVDNKLISDYRELIKTRLVTEQVINDLALVATRETLVGNLAVSIINDSRFMYVTFKDPVPERAVLIVNTLSEVLAVQAEEIVGVKNVQIVDYAVVPKYPISPSVPRNVAIAAVLGMMLALFIVFVQMMLENTVQTEEDIEKILGVPVLGMIPRFKGEARRK